MRHCAGDSNSLTLSPRQTAAAFIYACLISHGHLHDFVVDRGNAEMPSYKISPCVGVHKPNSSLAKVLLPEPVFPTSATFCPGSVDKEISRSTRGEWAS